MPAPPAGVSFVLFLAPCKFFSKKRGDLCAPRWRSGGLRAPSLPGRGRPRLAHGPRPNRRLEASSTVPANWVQEKLKDIASFQVNTMPSFLQTCFSACFKEKSSTEARVSSAGGGLQRAREGTSSPELRRQRRGIRLSCGTQSPCSLPGGLWRPRARLPRAGRAANVCVLT